MFLLIIIAITLVAADENIWIRVSDNCVRPFGFRRPLLCFDDELPPMADKFSLVLNSSCPIPSTSLTTIKTHIISTATTISPFESDSNGTTASNQEEERSMLVFIVIFYKCMSRFWWMGKGHYGSWTRRCRINGCVHCTRSGKPLIIPRLSSSSFK